MSFTTTRRAFQSPEWNQSQSNLTRLAERMYITGLGITYSSADIGGSGSGSSGGLPPGAIAGIVVACVAAFILLVVVMRRRSREWIMRKIFGSEPRDRSTPKKRTSPRQPPGGGTTQSPGTGAPVNNPQPQVGSQNAPHPTAGGGSGPQVAGNAAH